MPTSLLFLYTLPERPQPLPGLHLDLVLTSSSPYPNTSFYQFTGQVYIEDLLYMSWSRPLRTEESTEWVPYGLPILGSLCRDWPNWTVRHPNSSLVFLLPHIPSHPHLSLSPRHSSSSLTILTRSPPDGLPDQQLCLLSFSLLNSHTEPSKHSNLTELPCLKLFDNFPEPTGQSPSSQA